MASEIYIKSLIWLIGLGGLGYGLMLITQPSEDKLRRIKQSANTTSLTDDEKKKILFMQKFREAAGDKPILLKTAAKADEQSK